MDAIICLQTLDFVLKKKEVSCGWPFLNIFALSLEET